MKTILTTTCQTKELIVELIEFTSSAVVNVLNTLLAYSKLIWCISRATIQTKCGIFTEIAMCRANNTLLIVFSLRSLLATVCTLSLLTTKFIWYNFTLITIINRLTGIATQIGCVLDMTTSTFHAAVYSLFTRNTSGITYYTFTIY